MYFGFIVDQLSCNSSRCTSRVSLVYVRVYNIPPLRWQWKEIFFDIFFPSFLSIDFPYIFARGKNSRIVIFCFFFFFFKFTIKGKIDSPLKEKYFLDSYISLSIFFVVIWLIFHPMPRISEREDAMLSLSRDTLPCNITRKAGNSSPKGKQDIGSTKG